MKIRVAILDSNPDYLRRIVPILSANYQNELEVYSFSDAETALRNLEVKKIDILLAGAGISLDFARLPAKCGFAYLSDSMDVERINDQRAICKYQRLDNLYKQILNLYSDITTITVTGDTGGGGKAKTLAFTSPCGGVGTSTCAAACAVWLASHGYKVLFWSAEKYGSTDHFFSSDGQLDFSSVVYAIKSPNTNRKMKLRSAVKRDESGVSYYASAKMPLDAMEMAAEDYIELIRELNGLEEYDFFVVDYPLPTVPDDFRFFSCCHAVVLVSETGAIASEKTKRALSAIEVLDEQKGFGLMQRFWLLKNRSGAADGEETVRMLGNVPTYQPVGEQQIARQIALSDMFGNLIAQ